MTDTITISDPMHTIRDRFDWCPEDDYIPDAPSAQDIQEAVLYREDTNMRYIPPQHGFRNDVEVTWHSLVYLLTHTI